MVSGEELSWREASGSGFFLGGNCQRGNCPGGTVRMGICPRGTVRGKLSGGEELSGGEFTGRELE